MRPHREALVTVPGGLKPEVEHNGVGVVVCVPVLPQPWGETCQGSTRLVKSLRMLASILLNAYGRSSTCMVDAQRKQEQEQQQEQAPTRQTVVEDAQIIWIEEQRKFTRVTCTRG